MPIDMIDFGEAERMIEKKLYRVSFGEAERKAATRYVNKTIVICLQYGSTTAIPSAVRGRCGHDHMVVGFKTTYAINAYHH